MVGDELDIVHDAAVGATSSLELLAGSCSLAVDDTEDVDELGEDIDAIGCLVIGCLVTIGDSSSGQQLGAVLRGVVVIALCQAAQIAGRSIAGPSTRCSNRAR